MNARTRWAATIFAIVLGSATFAISAPAMADKSTLTSVRSIDPAENDPSVAPTEGVGTEPAYTSDDGYVDGNSLVSAAYGSHWDDVVGGVTVHLSAPLQVMTAGHSWIFGPSKLILSSGANGHLYMVNKHTNGVIWSAGDYPGDNKILEWQTDSNLVLYNAGLHASWASNTYHKCKVDPAGTYPYSNRALGLQDDGNMVIYCYHQSGDHYVYKAIWATGTYCHSPGSDYCKP